MDKFKDIKWKMMPGQIKASEVVEVPEGARVLRRFREGRGLSIEEFGRPLFVSGGYIRDCEKGISRISREFALRVEWKYGLKAGLLLE